jgi:uncharacterized membrane protein YeaQ/YmgE (transglycosylase-associated protein family)
MNTVSGTLSGAFGVIWWVWSGLPLMAVCGWTAGKVVGGKGLGVVADFLLGITGAQTMHFFLATLQVTVRDSDTLLLSVLGAAALPGFIRFLIRRQDGRSSTHTAELTCRVVERTGRFEGYRDR